MKTNSNQSSKTLSVSILSLSLLTVMAGAAVAPALGVIKEYFSDSNQLFVHMIISMPAIFIVITNLFFSKLAGKFKAKTLVLIGLGFYTIGGCSAGIFNTIGPVLMMRAMVGIGVGIIMPLSTGLLSFYYPPKKQEKFMGYSSAMNQMGGVVATLISGLLANISWRMSFLVYLMGLISIVLCFIFMPNDYITRHEEDSPKMVDSGLSESRFSLSVVFGKYYAYILGIFLLMTVFFIYPSSYAIVTTAEGIIPTKYISIIMASMDLVAFFGGLLFVTVKNMLGKFTKYFAPVIFTIGYMLLAFLGGWTGTIIGSFFIGFANGAGIPYIISTASRKAGKSAVTTVMPLISAALYLAQFISPFILSLVTCIVGNGITKLPYYVAFTIGIIFIFCSSLIKEDN